MNSFLGAKTYFCHAYCAWEKGLVENTIGLLRQYYPKQCPQHYEAPELEGVQTLLTNRPRKTLGFASPQELLPKLRRAS